ncbi:class I SAM-dependent methyltransferase [Candidatus Omnitrophota bacterium]
MSILSENYNRWHNNAKSASALKHESVFNDRVLNMLKAKRGQTILDVGCGTGSFCLAAFKNGLEITGLDFSSVALKKARSLNQKLKLILSDVHSLPFEDGFFDHAVCLGSLEHFSDKKKALREISRILKPSGKAFILLPNSYFIGHIYLVMKTGMPPDEGGQQFNEDFNTKIGWKDILEKEHFKVISIKKFNTIAASQKVSPITRYIYNLAVKHFIPSNLSYAFGYLCVKKRI